MFYGSGKEPFFAMVVVWGSAIPIGLFSLIVMSVTDGPWWFAGVAGVACSTGLMALIRYTIEGGKPDGLFNPKTQSWSFMYGDPVLTFSLLVFAWGGATKGGLGFGFARYDSWDWRITCMIVGFVAGAAFHLMDRGGYIEAGASGALTSASKLAHDFVAYPVFTAGLLFLGVPLLGALGDTWPAVAIGVAGIIRWGLWGIRDMRVGLDPFDLHPNRSIFD